MRQHSSPSASQTKKEGLPIAFTDEDGGQYVALELSVYEQLVARAEEAEEMKFLLRSRADMLAGR